jgi:hypothetical protein
MSAGLAYLGFFYNSFLSGQINQLNQYTVFSSHNKLSASHTEACRTKYRITPERTGDMKLPWLRQLFEHQHDPDEKYNSLCPII